MSCLWGNGTLSIDSGSIVSSTDSHIAWDPGTEGTVTVAGGATWSMTGTLYLGSTGTGTLNIGGADLSGTAGTVIASVIDTDVWFPYEGTGTLNFNQTDNTLFEVPIQGNISLNQRGSGVTMLTGTHTYSGDTTVSSGTLVVNGSITSPVTVQAGGTLGGSGSVGAVASSGTLAPGNTPETLNIAGDLILDPISILEFELDTPDVVGGGVNDLIEVNGNLTLDGTLNIIDWGNYGAGTYRLINYTGTLTDNGLDIGTQPAGFNAVLDTSTSGEVNLIVTDTTSSVAGPVHPLPIFNLPGLLFMVLLLVVSGAVAMRKQQRG